MMVVGGYGGHVLSDVWLLDVIDGSWSEVHVLYAHVRGVHMYTKKISASDLNSASSATIMYLNSGIGVPPKVVWCVCM